jgi:hypothetical protein
MSINTMAAVLPNDRPPIPFEEVKQLANLHATNLSYRFDLSMATKQTGARPTVGRKSPPFDAELNLRIPQAGGNAWDEQRARSPE